MSTQIDQLNRVFIQLSPAHQEAIIGLTKSLAQAQGIGWIETPGTGIQTPGEALPMWRANLKAAGMSRGTIKLYEFNILKLLEYDPTPTRISFQEFLACLSDANMRENGIKSHFSAARSFFSFLEENGLWQDITRNLKPPRITKREKKAPTWQEVEKLTQVLKRPKHLMLVSLLLTTGIRFEEMATLTWDRVDFERSRIKVFGKGHKERIIPIPAKMLEILLAFRQDSGLLFPTESRYGHIEDHNTNRMLASLCRKAGIPHYTCHQFRHFFATYTIRKTGKIKAVSELLGHASTAITFDYYVHTDEEEKESIHRGYQPLAAMPLALPQGGKQ